MKKVIRISRFKEIDAMIASFSTKSADTQPPGQQAVKFHESPVLFLAGAIEAPMMSKFNYKDIERMPTLV